MTDVKDSSSPHLGPLPKGARKFLGSALPRGLSLTIALFTACASAPSGRWVRPNTSDAQAKTDYDTCFDRASGQLDGMRGPWREAEVTENCMKDLGYKYEPSQTAGTDR